MKWIYSLLLFISIAGFGQSDDSAKYIHYPYQYGIHIPRLWADSVLKAKKLVKFTGLTPSTDTTTYKPLIIDASGNVNKMSSWPVTPGTDTNSLSNRINLKLNISDTTNKWVNDIRRSNDSVYIFKNGSWQFKYIDSTGGSNSNYEQSLGSIFQSANFTSLSGFTNNGATVSATGGHLAFSGGAAFNQTLDLDSNRCLEKWKIAARLEIVSTGNGPGIGIRSTNTHQPYSVMWRFNSSNGTSDLWTGNFAVTTTASGTLSFSIGDTLEMTCELDKSILTGTIRNVTTNSSTITLSYNYNLAGAGGDVMPNTGKFCIYNNGGSFNVDSFSVWSNALINPAIILVGDSKHRVYSASTDGNTVSALLNNSARSVDVLAGGSDWLDNMINRAPEIIRLAGTNTKIILGGCSNNIRGGQDSATYTHLYDSLVTILTNAGKDVYHITGLYETGINQYPFRNHIYNVYPAVKIIETLIPTRASGSLYSDNIHLNDAGQRIEYDAIVQSGKIVPINTTYDPGSTVIWNQTRQKQNGAFKLLGTGSIYGTDASTRLQLTSTATGNLIDLNEDHASNTGYLSISRQGTQRAFFGLGSGVILGANANDFCIRAYSHDILFSAATSGAEAARIKNLTGNFLINTSTPSGEKFQLNGSAAIDKDSIPIISSMTTHYLMVVDTTSGADSNKLKRVLPSNIAVTSINSQTGPSITISGDATTGVSASASSNTVTIATTFDLESFNSDANNTGTGETDLYSSTIAANKLTLNGKGLRFRITGTNNDATATAQIKGYFAGTNIFDSGALTMSAAGDWVIDMEIQRTTSTTAAATVTFSCANTTVTLPVKYTALTSQDWTTTNIFKVTGTAGGGGGGSNDITAHAGKVIFVP